MGYEDYSYDSVNKPYTTGELGGMLRTMLYGEIGPIIFYAPKAMKKFATGLGSAGKELLIKHGQTEYPEFKKLVDDGASADVLEAFYLAKYVWYTMAPTNVVTHDKTKLKRRRLEDIWAGQKVKKSAKRKLVTPEEMVGAPHQHQLPW